MFVFFIFIFNLFPTPARETSLWQVSMFEEVVFRGMSSSTPSSGSNNVNFHHDQWCQNHQSISSQVKSFWKAMFQAAGKRWGPRHSPCDQVTDFLHPRKDIDVSHFLKFHFYQGAKKDALLCGLLQSLRVGLELWGLSFWTSPSRGSKGRVPKKVIIFHDFYH